MKIETWLKKYPLQKMVRIDQSPMNERIWIVQLSCGHDVSVAQNSRPKSRTFHCYHCPPMENRK